MYPNFDISDYFLQHLNDYQIKKDYLNHLKAGICFDWLKNARDNNFSNEYPSENKLIIDPLSWEDLPSFLETAFFPRFSSNQEELIWLLRIKERYPDMKDIRRDYFVEFTLKKYLEIIASLEAIVGKEIDKNYGPPDTSDPKYWEIKREINDYYRLQKTPEEIYSFVYGPDNPYQELDNEINRMCKLVKKYEKN